MLHYNHHARRDYYIYLVLSETPTKFGKAIRRFSGIMFNHASVAFDAELRQLYSFGRHQQKNPLNAGLVREYPERFTLRRHSCINVRIYRIPVTKEQYTLGKSRILEIKHDPEGYLYNLFSVLSFPVLKGFHTYKAYSCSEFAAHLLWYMGLLCQPGKQNCAYTPEDIGAHFNDRLYFEGNLLDYWTDAPAARHDFFGDPGYTATAITSCLLPVRLLYRKIRFGNKFAAMI
ncbi:MAG: hypothetical protein GXY05_14530 [Clostridiales bacterium]|nr:hypothetical protein [Clostridiales bacterium]